VVGVLFCGFKGPGAMDVAEVLSLLSINVSGQCTIDAPLVPRSIIPCFWQCLGARWINISFDGLTFDLFRFWRTRNKRARIF
jgi:hypothetical protein